MNILRRVANIFNTLLKNLTLVALGIFVLLLEPITVNNVMALLKSNVDALNINAINQLLSVFNMHATLIMQSLNIARLAIIICTLLVSAQLLRINCIIPCVKTTVDTVDSKQNYTLISQLLASESKNTTANTQLRC